MASKPPDVAGAEEYFSQLMEIFNASSEASGGRLSFDYAIAGKRLRLNFAGPSLLSYLTPALHHLRKHDQVAAELTVSIWDETAATMAMPPPPWSWKTYMLRGEVGAYDRDSFRIWFDIGTGVFSMVDMQSNQAVMWVRDPGRLPIYVTAAPFRMILQAWLSQRGCYFAHAAAVGTGDGAVLLAGAGGSGKSTTSLVCLAGGMDFLGDDYCLIGFESVEVVYSAYCSAKLDHGMLRRLPEFQPIVSRGNDLGEDKSLLIVDGDYSPQLVPVLPVLALLVPRVTDKAGTSIERISALEGIRALAPSTMQQIAGPDPSAWRAITTLAGKVPSYRIEVGYDLDQIPQHIGELIEQLV